MITVTLTITLSTEGTVRTIHAADYTINQPAMPGCKRCETDAYTPHYSCLYAGKAMGHSESHCTASACN